MKERWLPVGILAGALFVVNVIARLVVRFAAGSNDDKQVTIGLWALVAIGVVLIPVAYFWARRWPLPRVLGDLFVAIVAACLLSVLIGPLVSGVAPFSQGVGLVFRQFFYFAAMSAGGVLLGLLAVMTVGQDYKSQAWKRYAERVQAKPRKVVRR
jgi:Na+/melibiose symporter-like transporter